MFKLGETFQLSVIYIIGTESNFIITMENKHGNLYYFSTENCVKCYFLKFI